MNTKNKTIKRILSCIIAIILVLGAQFGLLNLLNKKMEVEALNSIPLTDKISNPNFDSDKNKSTYPTTPSNFTAYSYNSKVTDTNDLSSNVTAGTIDLTDEDFVNKFTNASRGSSLDDYVLMIEAETNTNYGYRTNKSFTLNANGHYLISVDVYTNANEGIAGLYLYDDDGEVFDSITSINSYINWTTYSFFISTNEDEDKTLTLGMYLTKAGTVLFDNISVYELSNKELNLRSSSEAQTSTYQDLRNETTNEFIIDNTKLKNSKTNEQYEIISTKYELLNNANEYTTSSIVSDTDGTNSKAFLIENLQETYSQFSTADNFLTFEQNSVYKVSVTAKVKDLSNKAMLKLVQTNLNGDEGVDSDEISITSSSSSSNNVTNDYQTYNFYIYSSPIKSTTYKLTFGLGDEENLTTGKFYLSSVKVSKVNYSTYKNASGTYQKIDLVKDYSLSSNDLYLSNGAFNAFEIADYNNPYPATPTDWTVTLGDNQQYYGIVNTSATEWAKLNSSNFSNLLNPSESKANNNVLMLYNSTADTLSYVSKTKSLDANSYHKFTISTSTMNANVKISLVTTKDSKEIELASTVVSTSSQKLQDVNFYLHTGYQDLDVALKITLETDAYGYVFIDDAKFDYIVAPTEDDFNAQTANSTNVVADLTKFIYSNSNEQFAKTSLFSANDNDGVIAGIVNTNVGTTELVKDIMYNADYAESFASIDENQVLGIRSTADVYYSLTSNLGFNLTSDKYYRLSVKVFTQNIASNNSTVDASKLGAGIKLTNFDESFTQINTNGYWETYIFYIHPTSTSTTYLEFSIGDEDNMAKGDAFFGSITLEDDITESQFGKIKETSNIKVLSDSSTKDDNEETNKSNKSNASNINWWYAIPSIVFAVAIVIAVVAVLMRKVKWKKPSKKSKNAYDRKATVSKQYYERKATIERENKLRELNADLLKIQTERSKFEEQYKQDLSKLRQMKIARKDPSEIAKLEKEMKKNQKSSASYGTTMNKIQEQIEYVKTDAYLKSLTKKLSQSPVKENEKESEDENK